MLSVFGELGAALDFGNADSFAFVCLQVNKFTPRVDQRCYHF